MSYTLDVLAMEEYIASQNVNNYDDDISPLDYDDEGD
jgi:hypothetical protein